MLSSSRCPNPLVIELSALITIGITVTFIFHTFFFSSLARSRYFSHFSLSFSFTLWSAGTAKSTIRQVLFFFCWLSLGLVVWPKLDVPLVSQNLREFVRLIFQDEFWVYYYYSLIRVFHISVRWWCFTGVWVTASLLKSPGLFSVFWPFSIILSFRWSPLVRQLPSPPVPLVILLLLFQTYQLQLV